MTSEIKKRPPFPMLHDAAQQARNLRQVLQDDKQRIGCFLGAGCPLGVYDDAGEKSVTLIPAVVELTRRIAEGLGKIDEANKPTTKCKANWDSLCTERVCGWFDIWRSR